MRAAVVAVVLHAGRQARAEELEILDEGVVARVAVVAEAALRAEAAPQLAVVAGEAPGHRHARAAALARLEERHLAVERVAVGVLPLLVDRMVARRAHAGDLGEMPVRDARVEPVGMRGIVLRRQPDPPTLVRADRLPVRVGVVEILALGVDHLAEPARLVDAAHGDGLRTERRRLEERVDEPGLLHRLDHLRRAVELAFAEQRGDGAAHVVAAVEGAQDEVGVARRVRRDEHGVHVLALLVDHLLGGGIGALRVHNLGELLAAFGIEVGGRHHLHVRVVLEEEHGAERTHAVPGDAHAHLLVAERLPRTVRLRFERFVEALDLPDGVRRGGTRAQRRCGGERSNKKVFSCDLHVFILLLF